MAASAAARSLAGGMRSRISASFFGSSDSCGSSADHVAEHGAQERDGVFDVVVVRDDGRKREQGRALAARGVAVQQVEDVAGEIFAVVEQRHLRRRGSTAAARSARARCRRRRSACERERIVGSSRSGERVSRRNVVSRDGSSSVFSSEFDPLTLSPSAGIDDEDLRRVPRTAASSLRRRARGSARRRSSSCPPPTSTKCTSGCVRRSMRWHDRQSSPVAPFRQLSVLAMRTTDVAQQRRATGRAG